MKIGIVGPGALGCVFAVSLKRGGQEVFLVDYKEERALELNHFGLEVALPKGIILKEYLPVWTFSTWRDSPDFWILCVKNPSLDIVGERLKNTEAPLLSIQNGLGVKEKLEKYFSPEKILQGSTQMGAQLLGRGKARLAGWGMTFLDGRHPRGEAMANVFRESGIPVSCSPDIERVIWDKALLNSAINPLTALFQIQNGKILENPFGIQLLELLVGEGEKLARALNITISKDLLEKAREVLVKTGENFSSMAQDIREKKPTEIESLNGTLLQLAEQKGLELPLQKTVYQMIRFLEEENKKGTKKDDQKSGQNPGSSH